MKSLGNGHWAVFGPGTCPACSGAAEGCRFPPTSVPLPVPQERYQTIYARNEGSAAAPTAGFHFTKRVLGEAKQAGADIARITLHVGVGTFMPVRTERLEEHTMHAEHYSVPPEAARSCAREHGG